MAQDGFGGMYYTKVDATDYREEGAVGKKGLFFDELNLYIKFKTTLSIATRRVVFYFIIYVIGN